MTVTSIGTKGKNYFGVTNCHVAPITDEAAMTYASVVRLLGVTGISADAQTSNDFNYADDDTWSREDQDNGFDGTLSVRDDGSDVATRTFFAEACGYEVLPNGNVERVSGADPKPCAFGCEEEGKGGGRRRWYYKCYLGKPSVSQETTTNERTGRIMEYPFKAVPVWMPTQGKRSDGRTAYHGDANYDTFFDTVPFDDAGAASSNGAANQGQ